jgi:arabinofuranosyltransferase
MVSWVAVAGYLSWRFRGEALDDFFITYRYGLNLASGHGFVFNAGERVFALTNPGLALILALSHRLTGISVPVLASALSGVSLVVVAAVVLLEARAVERLPEAWLGGSLLVTASFLWVLQGGEGMVMLALLLLAARWGATRPLLAGALAGFSAWLRPEAAVGAGLLSILLWREHRRPPWRLAAAAAVVVLVGVLLAWQYFGTPVPNSLAAKRALAAGASGLRFWPQSEELARRHAGRLWPAVVGYGVIGQWFLLRAGGPCLRLLCWFALSLAVLYPLLGVPYAPWYVLPMAVALLYGFAFLTGFLVRLAAAGAAPAIRALALAAAAAAVVPVAFSLLPAELRWLRRFSWPPHMTAYRRAAEWLRANAPPGASVSYFEVGALGYFSDRTVIDMVGVVTPQLLPYVQRHDFANAFLARPGAFALYQPDRGPWMPVGEPWFRRAYRPVASFGVRGELILFARRPEAALPPADPPGREGAGSGP